MLRKSAGRTAQRSLSDAGRVSKRRVRSNTKVVPSGSMPTRPATTSPNLQDQKDGDILQAMAHKDDKVPTADRETHAASISSKALDDLIGSPDPPVLAMAASNQLDSCEDKPAWSTSMLLPGRLAWSDPWWDPGLDDREENKRWTDDVIFGGDIELRVREHLWDASQTEVNRFLFYCLPHSARWDSLDEESQTKIKAWAPKAERFISVPSIGGGMALFEGWVWRILYDNLLSQDCDDKWNGEHWAAFGKTNRSLRERVTTKDNLFNHTYHSWRSQSVHLLYARHGSHADPERLKNILLEELAPIIRLHPPWREIHSEIFSEMVRSIIEIDLCLLAATPNMVVELHDPQTLRSWGFPFQHNSREMNGHSCINTFRAEGEENGHPVDFICAPRLRVFGQVQGRMPEGEPLYANSHQVTLHFRRYDLCTYVHPMEVVVDQFPEDPAEGE